MIDLSDPTIYAEAAVKMLARYLAEKDDASSPNEICLNRMGAIKNCLFDIGYEVVTTGDGMIAVAPSKYLVRQSFIHTITPTTKETTK